MLYLESLASHGPPTPWPALQKQLTEGAPRTFQVLNSHDYEQPQQYLIFLRELSPDLLRAIFLFFSFFWYCQGWVKVLWLQNIQGMSVCQQASSRNERRKIVCFILRDSLLTNSSFVISLPLWTTKALLLLSKIFSSCLYQVVLLEDRASRYVCRTLPCTCSHLVHCGQVYGLLATHLPLTPPSFPLLPLFPRLVLLLLWEGIWGGPNLLINKSWVRSPHISVQADAQGPLVLWLYEKMSHPFTWPCSPKLSPKDLAKSYFKKHLFGHAFCDPSSLKITIATIIY